MQPTAPDASGNADASPQLPPNPQLDDAPPAGHQDRPRNFLVLAAYQVVMRTGWIFKTESVIMPAVLDSIAGAGAWRGWLPLLNRLGHSVPPLLLARRVKVTRRKKWVFVTTTALMAVLFLALAALFADTARRGYRWMPLLFLGIYAAFYVCIGVNHLAFNTLQGKLIAATRRGRLLLVSNVVGAATAVLCAFLLLPRWLQGETGRFDLIFAFSGTLFAASALLATLLAERPDRYRAPPTFFLASFAEAWSLLRTHRDFRRLAFVGAMFGATMMLFPHYQNIGLRGMRLGLVNLMWWVVVQNIGTGMFSIPAGAVADRRGNRLVLQFALLGIAAAPALAIVLRHLQAGGLYLFVFPLVGLTPVVQRTLQNFTLELSAAEDHPRYLSTLSLCISLPMFLSPLLGWCIDLVGFDLVFGAICGAALLGWLTTFALHEPREHVNLGFLQTSD